MRRLPEIDLARIAPLPREKKYSALRQVRDGKTTISYAPLRANVHDVMNVQPAMFSPVVQTDWAITERLIIKAARHDKERAANLGVAKALHDFGKGQSISARSHSFAALPLISGGRVEYWLDMVLALDGKPVVPFIDPRRSHGLTAEGRRFVFSMMHEQIRTDPDFADVHFGIIQFAKADDNHRTPIIHFDHGVSLHGHWDINEMVGETYAIWREVLEEGKVEIRRKAGGSGTLL